MTRDEIIQWLSQRPVHSDCEIVDAFISAGLLKVDEQSTKPFNPFAGPEVGKSIHEQPKEPSAEEKILKKLKETTLFRLSNLSDILIEYFEAKENHD